MSSRAYVAELGPEPAMRRVLAVSAALAYLLGIATIFNLAIDARLAALGALIWSLHGGAQWFLIASAHKRFQRLRIHSDGTAELLGAGGDWHRATICKDCIVLPGIAWLKLALAKGGSYCELVRRESCGNEQWRHLQVIWRHLGTVP